MVVGIKLSLIDFLACAQLYMRPKEVNIHCQHIMDNGGGAGHRSIFKVDLRFSIKVFTLHMNTTTPTNLQLLV